MICSSCQPVTTTTHDDNHNDKDDDSNNDNSNDNADEYSNTDSTCWVIYK